MSLKDIQIFNHRHYRLIRNICLGIILVALFIIPGVLQIHKLDTQAAKIDAQTAQIKAQTTVIESLTRDNKQLNIRLDQKTDDVQKSINCVGVIFAQFTNDNIPVKIDSLKKCIIQTGGTSGSSSPSTVSSPSSPSKTPTSATSPTSSQATPQSQSSGSSSSPNLNTPPPKPQPNLLQRIINYVNPFN